MSDEIECQSCGVILIEDAAIQAEHDGYCPKCGEFVNEEDAAENDAADHCGYCGQAVIDGECSECGECWECDSCGEVFPHSQYLSSHCPECNWDFDQERGLA